MRNLKRVLALALALIMTLGLMITASAASYADADQIDANYGEAIEVLTNMGVFRGQANGGESTEFAPKDILTRAEAATLVYRLLTADVTDAKKSNYDYTSFDDVKEGEWWTGYITYAANGKYVVGYGNGKFGPNDQVTGIEVLTIMLRALGYGQNGEFVGGGWKDHVLTTANENGMLKGVATDDLDKGASRELVAQLLFNAITVPSMVNYAPLTGYTKTAQTLGNKNFGLVEISGVVTANEYADLYDTEPQAEGKTVIGGKTYNVTTTLDDIGETRRGWATGKTVLFIEDPETDTIFETGAATKLGSKDFKKSTGLTSTDETEYFLNFGHEGTYDSDYRIAFGDPDYEATTSNQHWTIIKAGKPITAAQLAEIKDIFDDADDKLEGASERVVYVGTQNKIDISDKISFKTFKADYINDKTYGESFTSTGNGDWLKVIDNDGDGEADYVLKTVYTVTDVTKVDKKGTVTLNTEDKTLTGNDAVNMLTDKTPVVSEDELAKGDIVYYAVIDGNAQTYLADVVTAEINKVNRNTLTATTTDDAEYVQSDVNGAEYISIEGFEDGVKNLAGKTSYDLYLDKFGYLAVFTQTATSGDFVLLTDGWYMSQRTTDEYAVMAYIDGKLTDTDVTKNGNLFINTNRNNNWGQLKTFGDLNYTGKTGIWTTVASLSEDGTLTAVGNVFNKKTIDMIDMGKNIVDRDGENGTVYASNTKGDAYTETNETNVEVRALASTVYYYVYMEGNKTVVKEYVGYGSLPKLTADDKSHIEDVYAVATAVTRATDPNHIDYYTANVVVVEFDKAYKTGAEQVFVYDSPEVKNKVGIETLDVIRADGTKDSVDVDLTKSDIEVQRPYDPAYGKLVLPGLYYLWETNTEGVYTIEYMDVEDVAENNYAIGTVRTNRYTGYDNWTELQTYYNNIARISAGEQDLLLAGLNLVNKGNPEYKNADNSKYYTLSYTNKGGDSTGYYYDYTAKISEVDMDEALSETVREQKQYLLNTVLVAYNKDEIVYAISFARTDGAEKDGTLIDNYAQSIWASMLPTYIYNETDAPVVYVTKNEALVADYDGKLELTYAQFEKYVKNGKLELTVEPSLGNRIAVDAAADYVAKNVAYTAKGVAVDAEVKFTVKSIGSTGEEVKNYEFTITVKVASDAKLVNAGTTTEVTTFTIPSDKITIKEFIEQFELVGTNATIDWEFTTIGGTTFHVSGDAKELDYSKVPFGATMDEIASVTATVTAENGKSKTYKDATSAGVDALTAAIDKAVEDLNGFIAPLAASVGTDAESYISGSWLDQPLNDGTANTLYNVVNKGFADINAETVTENVANQLLVAEYLTVQNTGVVAINNLIRLVGGAEDITKQGTNFEGKTYWNNTIDAAFDAAYTDIMAAVAAVATDPAKALDDIIEAYNTAFAAIQDNILNTEPEYQAHFWVASDKGNVQIALMRNIDAEGKKAGTWLSQAEIEALNLTAAEFTVTLNGTDYSAKKIVSYLSSADTGVTTNQTLIDNNAGVIKINIGAGVFTSGQTLNLDYDGTKTGNVTFALDFATLNVDSFGGTIVVP